MTGRAARQRYTAQGPGGALPARPGTPERAPRKPQRCRSRPRAFAREHQPELPIVLVAGDKDRLVWTEWQSGRLHKRLADTRLHRVHPHAGHMVHHTAPDAVMGAIREAHTLGGG